MITHNIDDLDTDYKILASLVKTVDEEAKIFDFWINNDYDTELAIQRLSQIRKQTRTAARRNHQSLHDSDGRCRNEPFLSVPPVTDPTDLVSNLTTRQAEIWRLRAAGLTYEEVGLRVGCSRQTVYEELDRIQKKF